MAVAPRVALKVAAPPLALTASDGTGLQLAALEADAVVDGPLAFTQLHLTFDNPLDRQLEGTFRIALPQGASLARFAMKIGGEWQEGEVVELEAARRAYEDFLHRKQDPALMEKSAGNEFSARVFPIPARGTKEIMIAFAHELEGRPYTLPLKGLPELGDLRVRATVAGRAPQVLEARHTTPAADFVVEGTAPSASKAVASAIRAGELAVVSVRPQTTVQPDPIASAVVLVDTSASRVLGFEEQLRVVEGLMKQLASSQAKVTVAAFDQSVVPIFEGRAADFGVRDLDRLRERGALGASDLERAFAFCQEQAQKGGYKRVVLVTDGVATSGAEGGKALIPVVARLKAAGVERIDALAVGGIRDDVGLRQLVRGQVARDGVVVDAIADGASGLRRLGEATRSGIPVKVEGAVWAWPTKLDGAQSGDTYSVYVELPAAAQGQPTALKLSVDGKPVEVSDVRKTSRPMVERAVSQAKVSSMLEREATSREDLRKNIVSLAVRQRLVTPYTAMLVLETEADYARFHIDRKSLLDVLAIKDGVVERSKRVSPRLPQGMATVDLEADQYDLADESGGSVAAGPQPRRGSTPPADAKAPSPPRPGRPSGAPLPKVAAEPPRHARPPREVADLNEAAPAAPRARPQSAPVGGASAATRSDPSSSAPAPRSIATSPPARIAAAPPPPPNAAPRAPARPASSSASGFDRPPATEAPRSRREEGLPDSVPPYEGKLAEVMALLAPESGAPAADRALTLARAWHAEDPADVLGLVALGEAAEANRLGELAARAYGSVIDLFPNRADLRRFAGERLERVAAGSAPALAIDSFRKAVADRPDHPSSHRLYAFALLRDKQYARAFDAIVAGARHIYEADRFAGVDRILREDIGLVGAAWARAEPQRREEILGKVRAAGGRIEDQPSLRFVLDWQTDANDVDFHIRDATGGHAFFSSPELASGGNLYADVTTGYGPECFTIRLPKERRSKQYTLEAHYYSRGPMGYGMGKLEIIDHDGNGNLTFEERPYLVMVDSAYVDLGRVIRR